MRSTVARRLSTLRSFYRYCHLEGFLARNPTANVRRPKVDPESRTLGLDRNELGALLVQAGLGSPRDHALISPLAMSGLRISEALGANMDDLDIDPGHRTLRVVCKGGKQVTIPLAARHSAGAGPLHRRASDRAALLGRRWRSDGPLRRRPDGEAAGPAGGNHEADLTA